MVMEFDEITKLISRSFWLDHLSDLKKLIAGHDLTQKNFSHLLQTLTQLIIAGKKGRALNWLLLGLLLDQDRTIHGIKRNGLLRASRYDYNINILKFLSSNIVNSIDDLSLKTENSQYFQSLDNLLSISSIVKNMKLDIIKELKSRRPNVVKDLLATLEILFMKHYRNVQRKNSEDIGFYFRGEICEAISYLIYLYDEHIGIDVDCFNHMDEKSVLQFLHQDIVIEACKIKAYNEFEIFIDYYGYSCLQSEDNILLQPPTEYFEKALQHGYIFNELQSYNLFFSHAPRYIDEVLSLEKLVSDLSEKLSSELIERKKEPIERFIFKLPDIDQLRELLNSEQFFFEEIMVLTENCKELFSDFESLCDFKVYNNLTLFDLLKIHRLFQFIRIFFSRHLEKYFEAEPDIVVRSLVPVYSFENFTGILSIVIDKEKVQDFFDIFLWDKEKRSVLDLQYQPILPSDSHLIFPIHVYLFSNFLRNTLFAIKRRLHDPGTADPMTKLMVKLLSDKSDRVDSQVGFKCAEYEGDIDIISMHGDYIFIFECKRALLSGDVYELRTIYDHIVKAAEQLSKIKAAFSNQKFREYISQKLGWPIDGSKKVVSCIIMGNRMMSGYRCNGHPVRGFYELANFIYSGEVAFRDGKFCQWEGDEFSPKDLYEYLEKDSFHSLIFDSMFPHDIVYGFSKYTIRYKSFYTNYETIFQKYKENFQVK